MNVLRHKRHYTEITDDEQTVRYFIGFDVDSNHSWFIEKFWDADVRYVDGVPEVDRENVEEIGYVLDRTDGLLWALSDLGELEEAPIEPTEDYEDLPDPQ